MPEPMVVRDLEALKWPSARSKLGPCGWDPCLQVAVQAWAAATWVGTPLSLSLPLPHTGAGTAHGGLLDRLVFTFDILQA